MRLVRASAFAAAIALLATASARADDPCYLNPLRPVHVSAFVPTETLAPVPSSVLVAADELQLQRQCLTAEPSVSPRAQFAPSILSSGSAGSPRSSVTVFRYASDGSLVGTSHPVPASPGSTQPNLLQPQTGAPGFSLGAISVPAH